MNIQEKIQEKRKAMEACRLVNNMTTAHEWANHIEGYLEAIADVRKVIEGINPNFKLISIHILKNELLAKLAEVGK